MTPEQAKALDDEIARWNEIAALSKGVSHVIDRAYLNGLRKAKEIMEREK